MLRAFGCFVVIVVIVVIVVTALGASGCEGGSDPAGVPKPRLARTEVFRWSPFDAAGALKRTLRIKTVEGGCGNASGSEMIGGVGYRCGFGNNIIQTCWAANAGPTDSAICPTAPWDRTVLRLHIGPRFIFDEGVTYAAAPDVPWALELTNGNRCTMIATGTGPMPTPIGQQIDRYICADGINLAEPLRKGTPWTAAAARWSDAKGWTVVGYLPIRRAYFAGLPPAMSRQNRLASDAADAASRVALGRVRHKLGKRHYDVGVHLVRLAFPGMAWANVGAWVFFNGGFGERDVSVVVHRTPRGWTPVAQQAVCLTLPRDIRVQLLAPSKCR